MSIARSPPCLRASSCRSDLSSSLRSCVVASALIRDRAWVARRLEAGATVTAIAKEAGVSAQTAHTWLSRHGLHGQPRAKSRPTRKQLHTLYRQQGTIAGVAEVLDVAPGTAHRWLVDAGVELAAPGARRRLHRSSDLTLLTRWRAGGATLAELAEQFGVSSETIRRRLAELASTERPAVRRRP